ncbi:MAG: hypothetical protein WC879_03615 [Melioribacteraceae bacterium]
MKRSLSIIEKSDPTFFKDVGESIIKWLDQNKKARQKPGTQKELCFILERNHQIRTNTGQISRYIHGINKMPSKIENAITNLGFKSDLFVKHHASADDKLALDLLTKEDLFKLIYEQKLLLNEWKEMSFRNDTRFSNLQNENIDLVKMSRKLVEENDKLRSEIREYRKQLKKEE